MGYSNQKIRQLRTGLSALLLLSLSLWVLTAYTDDTSIPDRYLGDIPEVGYFGRMEKVLYSANAADTTIATNLIIDKIFGLMGMQVQINLYRDTNELKQDIAANKVDAIFINIMDYFEMEEFLNRDHIYALTLRPDTFEKTLLITRKEAEINRLSDLEGLRITIPSGSFLGRYFLDLKLMESGLATSDRFFSDILEVEDLNSAVISLFFGNADCALVTDIAFETASQLNRQISRELEVLLMSDNMIPQVIALNKNIAPSIVQEVDRYIVNAHEDPAIRNLLSLFKARKLIRIGPDQIQVNRRLLNDYRHHLSLQK